MWREFADAGYRIFGIHPFADGQCGCGNPECKALGKHPIAGSWQHTPDWSDEQLEVMEATGQFDSGYGVLVRGLLVIDVDARNGGVASLTKLSAAIPSLTAAGLIVETGSGGGSRHFYFSLSEQLPLVQHHADYPGIDFKSSGFVVGPGSCHASGNKYRAVVGEPSEIKPAPDALIALLRKPEVRRTSIGGGVIDISDADICSMLDAINSDCDHEQWYRIGMALHQATGGSGFALWDNWSASGAKYPGSETLEKRWHSFGKSANPVTIGTLVHYAQAAGWQRPVTFAPDWEPNEDTVMPEAALDISGIDLLRPPGFVGEVATWINSQSLYPRPTLAVAAALMAVSNCGGMRYRDPLDGSTFNLFAFGVADSSTGKEAILQAHNELLKAAGISAALVGGIKSEQEIFRNLVRHQAAYYSVDELGEHLAKITGSRSAGGAVYLQGVIGALMSIYSKASSFVPVTGDLKEEIKNGLLAEHRRLTKAVSDNEDKGGKAAARVARIEQQLRTVDMGLEAPFLSIFGLTTPERFNDLMDFDMAVNGFMGRALIFRELEKNPRIKDRSVRRRSPVPDAVRYMLASLYAPGYTIEDGSRVERVGETSEIQTAHNAAAALDAVSTAFWEMADRHKDETGLHPIPRRGYELVAKVSGILAMPSGLRTLEHVQWAYALVKRDIEDKMRLAYANSASDATSALASKILSLVSQEHGETLGAIQRACRATKPEDVQEMLNRLCDRGTLAKIESSGRGRPTTRFFRTAGAEQ